MEKILVSLLLTSAIVFAACAKSSQEQTGKSLAETSLIGDRKVGDVAIGMKIDDAVKLLGKPDSIDDTVYKFLSLGIELNISSSKQTIHSVSLLGPTYLDSPFYKGLKPYTGKTAKGIGIGSSKADVLRAYGNPSQKNDTITGDSSGGYGYDKEHIGFNFGKSGTVIGIILL